MDDLINASTFRRMAEEADRKWQSQERVRMCADWLCRAILDADSEFKGHEKRLAEQLQAAMGDVG